MLGVVVTYAGYGLLLVSLAGLARPHAIRLETRGEVLPFLAGGAMLVAVGWLAPAGVTRISKPGSELDVYAPEYEFEEQHETRVKAPPDRVFASVERVTADEIRFFRMLTWIRRFGRKGPESILNAPERMPILNVALRSGFVLLHETRGQEIVLGALVIAPKGADRRTLLSPGGWASAATPGCAYATMNFRVEPDGADSRLVTRTRVHATDALSRRRFAAYWRTIYPGSALIRRMWLRAIRIRAEGRNP